LSQILGEILDKDSQDTKHVFDHLGEKMRA